MFQITVEHQGLGKYKVIRGRDQNEVEVRAAELENRWNEQYDALLTQEEGLSRAKALTEKTVSTVSLLQNYLKTSLDTDYIIKKNNYKENSFRKEYPNLILKEKPLDPQSSDRKYYKTEGTPNILLASLLINLFAFFIFSLSIEAFRKIDAIKEHIDWFIHIYLFIIVCLLINFFIIYIYNCFKKPHFQENEFLEDKKKHQEECSAIDLENEKLKREYEKELAIWENEKEKNSKEIDRLFQLYADGNENSVVSIAKMWLSNLPEIKNENRLLSHPKSIHYKKSDKALFIDWIFPDFEEISPLPKEYKYIKSKDEIKASYHSDSFVKKLYNSLIYQIICSIIYSVFMGDEAKVIDSIILNGYMNTIDRSLGKPITLCVSSLVINRVSFQELNFRQINPKECFQRLKGTAAPLFQSKIPIKPIMELNKNDKRFIASYGVVESIDGNTNLAAMDWKDFENLIRELFEKKFSRYGGECKITQASRDGGVDAVAFNPDPILGGKIIIQAKRYTNTVGVSAVRDLYGTLINEGASKGILITTSDYGIDAHKFAEDKPIILINGNNLLQMLEEELKTKAYINIKEAKQTLKENEKK